MILLLGGSGYIGEAFAQVLRQRGESFRSVSRRQVDYTDKPQLLELISNTGADFLINAAGFTGKPNVDACERRPVDTLAGNVLLPLTIHAACSEAGIAWGHISSGCIYSGAKVESDSGTAIQKDLLPILDVGQGEESTPQVTGFNEGDSPNFSFQALPCSFYSGTKAMAEECLVLSQADCYLWRLRIPFDERDHSRNYLSKLLRYPKAYQNYNSISHRFEFANACLDLYKSGADRGIYNITNPGFISTREVIAFIQSILKPSRSFEFWKDDDEFYRSIAKAPRSNCVLNTDKLSRAGIQLRPVREALVDSPENWNKDKD